jgi:hypothetical protein
MTGKGGLPIEAHATNERKRNRYRLAVLYYIIFIEVFFDSDLVLVLNIRMIKK